MLETPAAEAFWHLSFRCEWCDYYSHCRDEAERTDDVSLVPYLSTFAKRHLRDVAGVETVADLRTLLKRKDRDSLLAGSASLDGRAHELELLVEVLAYLSTRNARSDTAAERYATGSSLLLQYEGNDWFRLIGPSVGQDVQVDDFPNFLLTVDDEARRRARLAYDDFAYRRAMYAPKQRPLAITSIREVTDDGRLRLELKTGKAWPGLSNQQTCVLESRYMDWNSGHVISELSELDGDGGSWFARLVADPRGTASPVAGTAAVRADALELATAHQMTPSQLAAFTGVLDSDVQLVWGPPGTGKTHFLAVTVLALLEAHRRSDQSISVLVTGFTNAAIDNCLDKIATLQAERHVVDGDFGLRKLKGSTPLVETLDPGSACGFCVRNDLAVVGATVWQARKTPADQHQYDVVVIDEGSQLTVAQAALAIHRLKPGGRQDARPRVRRGDRELRSLRRRVRVEGEGVHLLAQPPERRDHSSTAEVDCPAVPLAARATGTGSGPRRCRRRHRVHAGLRPLLRSGCESGPSQVWWRSD